MPVDEVLRILAAVAHAWRNPEHPPRRDAVRATLAAGNRFTEQALAYAVNQQMHEITVRALSRWQGGRTARQPVTVGVLGAGNVPFASLQDYLAVTITGHRFVGSESRRSPALLPGFAAEVERLGGPAARFVTQEDLFVSCHAIVASGSSETMDAVAERCDAVGIGPGARLLRGTRTSIAVIDGKETADQRIRWAEDVLLHEGQGCRNVAVTFAPRGLDVDPWLEALAIFRGTFPAHPSTPARLKMQQAFLKAVSRPHAQGEGLEFLVSRGEAEPQPPGHLRWTEFDEAAEVTRWIAARAPGIQVVATRPALAGLVPPGVERCNLGDTQRPPLDWKPDGRDTIEFLASIGRPVSGRKEDPDS